MLNTQVQASTVQEPLSEGAVLAAAEQAAGLSDWGADQSFRIGLKELLRYAEAFHPSPELRARTYNWVVQILVTKLHLIDDEKIYPEILQERIESPLIVVGLPRSGTTILFDLLALDPASRSPREWEISMPWPAPEQATFDTDPRIAAMQAAFDQILEAAPGMRDIQRLDARLPGECNAIMSHHFASLDFAALLPVPGYDEWYIRNRVPGQYPAHRRILQQLQWRGPRGRWLLKSPVHLFDLNGLLDTYPDAQLVWSHRDPTKTLSSISSHIHTLHTALGSGIGKDAIGAEQWRNWRTCLEAGLKAREENPAVEEAIFDIANRDLLRDPVAAIASIYGHFNRVFTDQFAARIAHFMAHHEAAGRVGRHRHSLTAFGLDESDIRTTLAPYYQRFGQLC